MKNLLMRICGTHQLMTQADYIAALERLVQHLASDGVLVLVLEPTAIDERYFPGAAEQQHLYAASARASGYELISLDRLVKWDDYFLDHFHPNETGHAKIAEAILERLSGEGIYPSPEHEKAS